jgi:glycosyltransferase involved in cell wall biosynthesis
LDGVSVLMFPQMVASPTLPDGSRVHLIEPLCREARSRGIPIVYSVDDCLHEIEQQNPGYETVRASIRNLHTILEQTDAIIVTTDPLRDTLSRYGKPIHLLPNAVDPSHWEMRPRSSSVPRVGWSGSSSHLDDMLMVLPAIRALQQRIDCLFVVQGLTDLPLDEQIRQIRRGRRTFTPSQSETADRFLEVARRLGAIRHHHVPFTDTAAFFRLLPSLDLDLGICPLLDTAFNRHKSANKFYEYAVTGSATLASRVTPYRDEVSATVPNETAEWCDALERYLRDERARDEELERQREYVLAERNIERLRERWAAALTEIVDANH